jgi:hypothetical protein
MKRSIAFTLIVSAVFALALAAQAGTTTKLAPFSVSSKAELTSQRFVEKFDTQGGTLVLDSIDISQDFVQYDTERWCENVDTTAGVTASWTTGDGHGWRVRTTDNAILTAYGATFTTFSQAQSTFDGYLNMDGTSGYGNNPSDYSTSHKTVIVSNGPVMTTLTDSYYLAYFSHTSSGDFAALDFTFLDNPSTNESATLIFDDHKYVDGGLKFTYQWHCALLFGALGLLRRKRFDWI